MPIYDFICEECDVVFEKIVKNHDSTTKCPSCNKEITKKLLGTPMVKIYDSDLADKQKDLKNYIY